MYKTVPPHLAYTIVRPSGLGSGPFLGVTSLEINQGDEFAGDISRADLAAVCVECASSEQAKRVSPYLLVSFIYIIYSAV